MEVLLVFLLFAVVALGIALSSARSNFENEKAARQQAENRARKAEDQAQSAEARAKETLTRERKRLEKREKGVEEREEKAEKRELKLSQLSRSIIEQRLTGIEQRLTGTTGQGQEKEGEPIRKRKQQPGGLRGALALSSTDNGYTRLYGPDSAY